MKTCELYLRLRAATLPGDDEFAALAEASGSQAALLTALAPVADRGRLRAFISMARVRKVSILIESDPDLASAVNADGVHIAAGGDLKRARSVLGEDKLIGVSCRLSRHEAMTMAEAGADYIAFGEIGAADETRIDEIAEMTRWWDELFETPCVAWLGSESDEAAALALIEAGADYLAVAADGPEAVERLRRLRTLMTRPAETQASSP